uniref:Uncharacterized protein n=1 Tax=Anguilla anguilla TaxID=7936 RepID=A0A0E9WHV0_ANGAN
MIFGGFFTCGFGLWKQIKCHWSQ